MQQAEEVRFIQTDPSQVGYTRAQFRQYYGDGDGESFWRSASVTPPEIRYDTDGNAYTQAQFEAFYGANYRLFWDKATAVEESADETDLEEPEGEGESAEEEPEDRAVVTSAPADGGYCRTM
jgi:hypothetical protein